jgi:hypothetical protein
MLSLTLVSLALQKFKSLQFFRYIALLQQIFQSYFYTDNNEIAGKRLQYNFPLNSSERTNKLLLNDHSAGF